MHLTEHFTVSPETPTGANAPVGVFDSGVGGLSVLQHIRQLLPREHLLYFADSAYAPYGDKSEKAVAARSLAITRFLRERHVKALVVACNTATAAAIHILRETYPSLPMVGVEPGLKPAAAISGTGRIGVLATEGTLGSSKFNILRDHISKASDARFFLQACVGLADQIEKGELRSAKTASLVQRYVAPLLDEGIDTLVLGCTHYPFVRSLIEETIHRMSDRPITIVDTGEPVARQLIRLLEHGGLTRSDSDGGVSGYTSGSETALRSAFSTLLGLRPPISPVRSTIDAKFASPPGILYNHGLAR